MANSDSKIRDERNRRWDEPFGDEPLDAVTVIGILARPPFADIDPSEFPEWLPLDQIIANDGRMRRYQRGDVIVQRGDYGNSMFAILQGSVIGRAASRKEQDGTPKTRKSWARSISQLWNRPKVAEYRPTRQRTAGRKSAAAQRRELNGLGNVDVDDFMSQSATFTLRAPEIFGELAALTRSPRTASIVAAEDGTLLFELRWQGMRDIRTRSSSFRQRIDMLYLERGLRSRLRECPVLHHVDQQALDEIAAASLFETYGSVDWMHRFKKEIGRRADTGRVIEQETVICEQGHHVDGLMLINSGFARVTERIDHGQQTVDHLSLNDVFGLDEIAEIEEGKRDVTLKASLRAIGYVDVIRIPTSLIRKHVLPGLPARFRGDRAATGGTGRKKLRQEMMDFVVDHRFMNGRQAMVINLDRCVGCDDCVRACATAHDNNPRFTRHGFNYQNVMVANACMHCTDPVCLIGCPTGAIHRQEETGTVVIDDSTCIGCATCANSCPYNNIKMVEIRDAAGDFVLDNEGQPINRATKCDLCSSQLTGPACAQACPHDALIRVDIRDTQKLLAWLG
jgi:Fe-S-cluster-containing dehydrogenase component/CRP-like cAMP-binding protein